jgi:hypothetical protein
MTKHLLYYYCACAIALGAWLGRPTVRADVAPEDGYVEKCTLEKACPLGQECVQCPADYRDYSGKPVCEQNLLSLGFSKQCQSGGASVWEEIWCRPVSGETDASVLIAPTDAGRPIDDPRFDKRYPVVVCTPQPESGCDGCAVGSGESTSREALGWTLSAAGLALIVARRRRLRRRA